MVKNNKKQRINKFNRDDYKIWANGRLFSLILLGVTILMFILSIVSLPFFAIFPGYTFGLFFGYYSYFFYLFIIYYSMCNLFNLKIYLIKIISKIRVFHYSWLNFWILIFGLIILLETSLYISKNDVIFPGIKSWTNNFNDWWFSFTINNNVIEPNIVNPGVIVNIIISSLFSICGSITSIILSIIFIFYFIFCFLFSSPIQKINNNKIQKKAKEVDKWEHETKIINLDFENDNKIIVSGFKTEIINSKELINKQETIITTMNETIPFHNPFNESDEFTISKKNIKEVDWKNKSKMISETDFIFDNSVQEFQKIPDFYQITKELKIKKRDHKYNKKEREEGK